MTNKSPRKGSRTVNKKKIVLFFTLFLALPVVVLGALSPQDFRQRAQESPGRPNIILITVPRQQADTLSFMPVVSTELVRQGMTFRNAYFDGYASLDANRISGDLERLGYKAGSFNGETESVVQEAGHFVTTASSPFFLHVQFNSERSIPERCGGAVTRTPDFNEADVSDKPGYIRSLPRISATTERDLINQEREAICRLQKIDEAIGKVLRALRKNRENTFIVYTAHTGMTLGEHRLIGQDCLYNACRQVPLVISYPRLIKKAVTSSELVSSSDILPTLLEVAGRESEKISLVPLLVKPDIALRSNMRMRMSATGGEVVSVRTKEFQYIEYPNGERELYDLEADPYQLMNKVTAAEYRTVVDDLTLEMAQTESN